MGLFKTLWTDFLLHVFLWSGTKLWGVLNIYAPDGEGDDVRAMIFCDTEITLNKILRGYTNPDAESWYGKQDE